MDLKQLLNNTKIGISDNEETTSSEHIDITQDEDINEELDDTGKNSEEEKLSNNGCFVRRIL